MLLKVIEFSIICLMALQHEVSSINEVNELREPLKPKMTVKITGDIISWTGRTFHVDLQEAKDDRGGDTYLHMSVRYAEKKLVLNSWINGEWGEEEVYEGLPPRIGSSHQHESISYDVQITARDNDFYINLNGRVYTFKYRMPKEDLGKINFVVISGDFKVTSFDLV